MPPLCQHEGPRVLLVEGRDDCHVVMALCQAVADADFVNDPFPFLNTPLSFGARAQDVLEGAQASVGIAVMDLRFSNTAPGAALPDLAQMLNNPQPEHLPLRLSFRALAPGTAADGTQALLEIRQTCRGELDDAQGTASIVCDEEVVDIR